MHSKKNDERRIKTLLLNLLPLSYLCWRIWLYQGCILICSRQFGRFSRHFSEWWVVLELLQQQWAHFNYSCLSNKEKIFFLISYSLMDPSTPLQAIIGVSVEYPLICDYLGILGYFHIPLTCSINIAKLSY